jgi:hypothetical protein
MTALIIVAGVAFFAGSCFGCLAASLAAAAKVSQAERRLLDKEMAKEWTKLP